MSDSESQWVIPALLVLVFVGVTMIGFTFPNSQRPPESIVDEWKNNSFGKTIDGWFSRQIIRPCAESPRPSCCNGERVEMEGMCMLAISAGEDGVMRRIAMQTAKSPQVKIQVEATAKNEKHSQRLDWKNTSGNRLRAIADFGPEPVALVIQCAKRCIVEFE